MGSGSHCATVLRRRRFSIWSAYWILRAVSSDLGAGGGDGVPSSCVAGVVVGVDAWDRGDRAVTSPPGLQYLLLVTLAGGGALVNGLLGGMAAGGVRVVGARPALMVVPLGLAGLALMSLAGGCCCLALVPLAAGCLVVGGERSWVLEGSVWRGGRSWGHWQWVGPGGDYPVSTWG